MVIAATELDAPEIHVRPPAHSRKKHCLAARTRQIDVDISKRLLRSSAPPPVTLPLPASFKFTLSARDGQIRAPSFKLGDSTVNTGIANMVGSSSLNTSISKSPYEFSGFAWNNSGSRGASAGLTRDIMGIGSVRGEINLAHEHRVTDLGSCIGYDARQICATRGIRRAKQGLRKLAVTDSRSCALPLKISAGGPVRVALRLDVGRWNNRTYHIHCVDEEARRRLLAQDSKVPSLEEFIKLRGQAGNSIEEDRNGIFYATFLAKFNGVHAGVQATFHANLNLQFTVDAKNPDEIAIKIMFQDISGFRFVGSCAGLLQGCRGSYVTMGAIACLRCNLKEKSGLKQVQDIMAGSFPAPLVDLICAPPAETRQKLSRYNHPELQKSAAKGVRWEMLAGIYSNMRQQGVLTRFGLPFPEFLHWLYKPVTCEPWSRQITCGYDEELKERPRGFTRKRACTLTIADTDIGLGSRVTDYQLLVKEEEQREAGPNRQPGVFYRALYKASNLSCTLCNEEFITPLQKHLGTSVPFLTHFGQEQEVAVELPIDHSDLERLSEFSPSDAKIEQIAKACGVAPLLVQKTVRAFRETHTDCSLTEEQKFNKRRDAMEQWVPYGPSGMGVMYRLLSPSKHDIATSSYSPIYSSIKQDVDRYMLFHSSPLDAKATREDLRQRFGKAEQLLRLLQSLRTRVINDLNIPAPQREQLYQIFMVYENAVRQTLAVDDPCRPVFCSKLQGFWKSSLDRRIEMALTAETSIGKHGRVEGLMAQAQAAFAKDARAVWDFLILCDEKEQALRGAATASDKFGLVADKKRGAQHNQTRSSLAGLRECWDRMRTTPNWRYQVFDSMPLWSWFTPRAWRIWWRLRIPPAAPLSSRVQTQPSIDPRIFERA